MNYILNITPQTNVRSTQGDAIYFRIPEDKLRLPGLKRKKRLQRYNSYKRDLATLVMQQGLIKLLEGGEFDLVFHIPAPKFFRPVKGKEVLKRNELEGTKHQRKPDWDNLSKAFCDGIWGDDSFIWNVRVKKVWTTKEVGWIEIITQ